MNYHTWIRKNRYFTRGECVKWRPCDTALSLFFFCATRSLLQSQQPEGGQEAGVCGDQPPRSEDEVAGRAGLRWRTRWLTFSPPLFLKANVRVLFQSTPTTFWPSALRPLTAGASKAADWGATFRSLRKQRNSTFRKWKTPPLNVLFLLIWLILPLDSCFWVWMNLSLTWNESVDPSVPLNFGFIFFDQHIWGGMVSSYPDFCIFSFQHLHFTAF